jgi:hypothetical protein
MTDKNAWTYKIGNYFKKIKWIIVIIFIVIILFALENSTHTTIKIDLDEFNYSNVYESDSGNFILKSLYIFIMFICLALCIKKLIKKHIIVEQEQIKIIDKLFCLKIKGRYYLTETINKIIIGLIPDKHSSYVYNIYIDQNNNMYKVHTLETYKECMAIMDQIKEKSNIKIFDGTDRIYPTEEDLYREYYKLKNMIKEIKNE